MKKETINTFEGGLMKDLHPLTTPKNVLTDALNATYITYNGNEYILQNDMGNVKIKNALLKAGYVPVGMKEHGGIVYVAAYNPKTGKGQVGSFPSPKQLWEGENWTVNSPAAIINNPTINVNFYSGNFIVNEILKTEIFSTSGDPRIFHPGDKFIIGITQAVYTSLSTAIDADYMDIQLGVVKSDGSIEVMRTWSKTSPDNIFLVGDATAEGALNDASKVKVFDASSSGQLLLIINLHTLDSFSLNKKYSLVGENIQVKFLGEGQRDGKTYTSSDPELGLCKEEIVSGAAAVTVSDASEINVTGKTGKKKFTIYPNVPFGIVKRMGRTMTVDFDKIRNNQDDFGEWRFFVTDKYVKIGWSYDYYNLDESKEIEYIRMYFHPLEDGYTMTNKDALPHVEFQREYFSGNFEDYINYEDIGLTYKRIYIAEIVKKFKDEDEEKTIDFKMLYLSKLYNSKYNGFYDNKSIGLFAEDSEQKLEFDKANNTTIPIQLETKANFDLKSSITKVRKPNEETLGYECETGDVTSSLYTVETTDSEYDQIPDNNKIFVTQVHNIYDGEIEIKGKVESADDMYIGKPRTDLIQKLMETYSVTSPATLENEKEWMASTTNKTFPDLKEGEDPVLTAPTASITSRDTDSLNVKIGEFSDYTLVQGFSSEVKSNTFDTKGLKPLLSPSYTKDRKDRVAPYWDQELMLCISGEGDEDKTMWYNSTLTSEGDVIMGPDAGGGCDDGGLRTASALMGRPTTNIFAGVHGEDAELCFDNLTGSSAIVPGTVDHHVQDSTELDILSGSGENGGKFLDYQDDNYLVACWKFTDSEARFVNLITPKTRPVRSDVKWPRLDVMLRCILSQIFIVNKVSKTVNYVTTNERFYRYQEGTTKVKIKLTHTDKNFGTAQNPLLFSTIRQDIMVSEFGDGNKTLNEYLQEKWGFNGNSITVKVGEENGQDITKSYTFNNLIPSVQATLPNIDDFIEVEVPNYYDLAQILEYYQGAAYKHMDEELPYELGAIYSVDTTQAAANAEVCAKRDGTKPKANLDGTYEWLDTPKCVKVTGTMTIHRWNDASNITFPGFGTCFTTRASRYEWADIPEGEENEVYANTENVYTCGQWTDAVDYPAPDMYYKTLYSPEISALSDKILKWVNGHFEYV